MDIGKLFTKVNNLNEYIAVTEEASEKCYKSGIQLNMSNVLALTKIRSLEIEHINKCEQNGIACIIIERMLALPPSKTWEVLSRQMVNLLQYWLDAVRKHLIKHSAHWWTFLKLLLKYIKEICHKDSSLPNILVEHTSVCLLDLATTDRPDAMQRYEILHCFNLYSAESSREIRFALKSKLDQYFVKLSAYMCGCGHLPTQYSIMETLLRWLVPRHDQTIRITSATKWFPAKLYSDSTVDIFLERPWKNFFQDARDFLNMHNSRGDLVTSVVCSKLTVGNTVIISDKHYKDSWLDLNRSTKCISVLLDPKVLEEFGCTIYKSFETLIIAEENISTAKLFRESQLLLLSLQTINPPYVLPSHIKLGDDVGCDVTAVMTSHCDVKRLDNALRIILDDKYQLLLDMEKELALSSSKPHETSNKSKSLILDLEKEVLISSVQASAPTSKNKSEERTKFSHPVEVRRAKHSGCIIRQRKPLSCKSPSTASTSSLAQLPERLAELPQYRFDKKRQSVCATPELSRVTEVSETDDKITQTRKYPFGVCYMKQKLDINRKSQSDNESMRRISEFKKREKFKQLSPVVNEDAPSCLLIATIGSADDTVINDTVERISKSADLNADNIVDLLVQEALNANLEKDTNRSINTGEQIPASLVSNCDAIENTPNTESFVSIAKKKSKVVSSTSDESNTEGISDTPNVYVTRRKIQEVSKRITAAKTLDIQEVEQFFSKPTETSTKDIVISPTLAQKINKSSSETSDDVLDTDFILMGHDLREIEPVEFNNLDVIECLNNIVDRVCEDFDKCTKYLSKDKPLASEDSDSDFEANIPLKNIVNAIQNTDTKRKRTTNKITSPKKIKLKYKKSTMKDKTKTRLTKRTKKLDLETKSKMSTIIEDSAELIEVINDALPEVEQNAVNIKATSDNTTEITTPLLRKKRKLFSPKDEQIDKVRIHSQSEEKEVTDTKQNKTIKSTCTYKPYKDIEIERQKHIRLPRNRKSRLIETSSPGSKTNNDLFDKVKQSTNNEQVTLAKKSNNLEVYNFSSDSEDDFRVKKTSFTNKKSAATPDSESTILRDGKVVKRFNNSSKNNNKTKRNISKNKKMKKNYITEPIRELIDERMRENKELLNNSIAVEQPKTVILEPELVLEKAPEMELIKENNNNFKESQKKIKRHKYTKAKTAESERVVKTKVNMKVDNDDDRTVSPLPGLVVEEAFTISKADGESPAKMIEKFKKICQNPEKYINESNTTQNLLSDNERIIYSPVNIDVTGELPPTQLENKVKSNQKNIAAKEKVKNIEIKNQIMLPIDDASRSESASEQSIATLGINGHGDSEEAPPSPELIARTLEHRELGTEHLDRSTKDYFDKLREELNDINTPIDLNKSIMTVNSNKLDTQANNLICKKSNTITSLQSPVVSVKRMSLDDIRAWLPSSRNSESGDQSQISSISKRNNKNVEAKLKNIETVISIHGNDTEDDQEMHSPNKTALRLSKKASTNSQTCNKVLTNLPCIKPKKIIKKTRVLPTRNAKCTPKSIISPIKLFDDLISNVDKLSQSTLSEDEDFIADIKKTKSRIEKSKKPAKNLSQAKSITEISCIKKDKTEIHNEMVTKLSNSESSRSKISVPSKIDHTRTLKRSLEEDIYSRKKKKVEDKDNIEDVVSRSEATVSSVNDWLKNDWLNEPGRSRTGNVRMSVSDTIQNVMEKLDTTLVEINQSTSNKFVNIFVCAQQQLRKLMETRQSIYKTVGQELLTTMVQVIDEKFDSLDKRSQEQDLNFMKQLKEQATEVIREDCKQKRIMVQLLKEDVEAVLEYERRNK